MTPYEAINMWNRSYKQIATKLVESIPNHVAAVCWKGWIKEFRAFVKVYEGKINPTQADVDAMKDLAICLEIVLTMKKREDAIAAQTKQRFDSILKDVQGMLAE